MHTCFLGGSVIPAQIMTFSSYPGSLLSGDDFYILNTGLVSELNL